MWKIAIYSSPYFLLLGGMAYMMHRCRSSALQEIIREGFAAASREDLKMHEDLKQLIAEHFQRIHLLRSEHDTQLKK